MPIGLDFNLELYYSQEALATSQKLWSYELSSYGVMTLKMKPNDNACQIHTLPSFTSFRAKSTFPQGKEWNSKPFIQTLDLKPGTLNGNACKLPTFLSQKALATSQKLWSYELSSYDPENETE